MFTLTEESKYVSIAGKREATPFTQAPELVGIISKSPEIFSPLKSGVSSAMLFPIVKSIDTLPSGRKNELKALLRLFASLQSVSFLFLQERFDWT